MDGSLCRRICSLGQTIDGPLATIRSYGEHAAVSIKSFSKEHTQVCKSKCSLFFYIIALDYLVADQQVLSVRCQTRITVGRLHYSCNTFAIQAIHYSFMGNEGNITEYMHFEPD